MSAKIATPGFLKIKVFWNKGYDELEILHQFGKRVKTKSQKVLVANSYVCRSYRGKTVQKGPPSWIGLIIYHLFVFFAMQDFDSLPKPKTFALILH